MRELVPVNTDYALCDDLSQPVLVELNGRLLSSSLQIDRDNITDEQCGEYRECFTKPSDVPGCGIRIQTDGVHVSAECPAGTEEPYRNCARRVLGSIMENTPHNAHVRLQGEPDYATLDPELVSAVHAIRNLGVETIASHAGIDQAGLDYGWGSYIQVVLFEEGLYEKFDDFAKRATDRLQAQLDNPAIEVQLVPALKWHNDRYTKPEKDTQVPIYRLQLVGHVSNDEIRHAWADVASSFGLDS